MCGPCSSAKLGSNHMTDANHSLDSKKFRIPEGSVWAIAWKMSAALGAIGTIIALAGAVLQPQRFAFSYLYGFITVLTLWLGSVFFVLIQHLTSAGWSVTVRRSAEFVVSAAWILPVLFLPMLPNLQTLYPWWGEEDHGVAHAQEHEAQGHADSDRPLKPGVGYGEREDGQAAAVGESVEGEEHGPHHL